MNEVIRIEKVSKSFQTQKVLDEVSLGCEEGKIYGVVGYNGSGKTVLFKCLCGFLRTDGGRILVRGKELHKDFDMLPNTGVIIEEPAFLAGFSGIRNLEMLYRIHHRKDRKKMEAVMRQVGLDPGLRKRVEKYSLGMRQRLAVAQAIMEEQDILVLDEPMNGLDKQGIRDMRELFLRLKGEGKTILFASHNKEDIELLCDEVYEMDGGRLERVG
ncbi:MAG: ABC transporter ATP-binding protein [Clostridium sp.]|jgi:ABC-2 type transport system ATP-binding protein|nr:ABC transporter ATP-binding protein [Clostridium sp.]